MFWGLDVNRLLMECGCGHRWHHRADRWRISCPRCRKAENLGRVRERYVADKVEELKEGGLL